MCRLSLFRRESSFYGRKIGKAELPENRSREKAGCRPAQGETIGA